MADLEKTIKIIFAGDDQLSKSIRSINSSFGKFDAVVTSVAAPLSKVADSVIRMDAALAAMAVGGLALAVTSAGQFNDSFLEITTLIPDLEADLGGLKTGILDYARESGSSLEDINAALYSAISAGVDYADALGVLSVAEQLSIAGKADLEATTILLASTLNAYGASIDEATRYSDAFFTTVQLGQTTLPEMAQYLSQVSSLAASAGIPIETLAAAIAALTATGMPTAEAMTAIRAAISNIIKPSTEAEKTAAQLGIQFNATALNTKGFEVILQEVAVATGGNVDEMAKLFGSVRGLSGVLALTGTGAENFTAALDRMANKAGVTAEAAERMAVQFRLAVQKIVNNLKVTLIDIGSPLLEQFGGTADALSKIFQGISISLDAGAFTDVYAALDTFWARVNDFLNGVAAAIPEAFEGVDYSGLLDSFENLADTISSIFDLDLTDPKDLEEAFQRVVNAITLVIDVTSGMVKGFEPYLKALVKIVDGSGEVDRATAEAFGQVLANAKLITEAGVIVTGALAGLGESGASARDVFNVLAGSIKAVTNLLELTMGAALLLTVSRFKSFVNILTKLASVNLVLILTGVTGKLKDINSSLGDFQGALKDQTIQDFQEGVEGAKQALAGFSGEAYDAGAAAKSAAEDVGTLNSSLTDLPDEKIVKVEVAIADPSLEKVFEQVETTSDDLAEFLALKVTLDTTGFISEADALVESADTFGYNIAKYLGFQAELDTEPLKEDITELEKSLEESETTKRIRDLLDFRAKIDIAEIESQTKIMEASLDGVAKGAEKAADNVLGLFTLLTDSIGIVEFMAIQDQLKKENDIRERAADLQEKLVNSQIDLNKAKTERLESGEPLIQISGEGLEIELEAFMWKILQKVQIRATEEYSEFLIGIPT